MYKRFKWDPHIRPDFSVFVDVAKLKKPSKIFIGSTHDIFGSWVNHHWIYGIIDYCQMFPQHIFLFLTKNPKRYLEFSFPENCWLGATLTGKECFEEVGLVGDIFREIKNIKFISYEPFFVMPNMFPNNLNWVIIGGLTPKPVHEQKWVDRMIGFFRLTKVPIFLKDNLKWHEEIKEYPGWNN